MIWIEATPNIINKLLIDDHEFDVTNKYKNNMFYDIIR